MADKGQLTSSLEDYLKHIYVLDQDRKEVRVTDIAASLGISKPSVNRAVNTLKEMGYIQHEHYGTILLTEEGMAAAKNVLDTYKVVNRFLVDVLGVDEETAEKEAHLIEHDISKGTRKKMKKFSKKKSKGDK